jgi:hypothetical protein
MTGADPGVAGNARLTAATGLLLLVLLGFRRPRAAGVILSGYVGGHFQAHSLHLQALKGF